MKFITHHRFKTLAICGERLNIPYGTELEAAGDCIVTKDGKAVCYYTSENAKLHFAQNDDGRGIERGRLTYAIAYGGRRTKSGYRFSEEEAEILAREWKHFLRQDVDVILFNDDFFAADPDELRKIAVALNIRVRR